MTLFAQSTRKENGYGNQTARKDTVTRDCEIQEALPLLTRRRDTCGLRDGAFGRFVGDSGG